MEPSAPGVKQQSSRPGRERNLPMRVHASVLIHRPITAVFTYLSTPDRLPCWVAGLATAAGPPLDRQGVGARLLVGGTTGPESVRSAWDVTAYEPPRSLALRGRDTGEPVEVRWTLEGRAGGDTRVCLEADLVAVGFFRPPPAQLEALGVRQLQADLEVLRQRLEQDGAQGPTRATGGASGAARGAVAGARRPGRRGDGRVGSDRLSGRAGVLAAAALQREGVMHGGD